MIRSSQLLMFECLSKWSDENIIQYHRTINGIFWNCPMFKWKHVQCMVWHLIKYDQLWFYWWTFQIMNGSAKSQMSERNPVQYFLSKYYNIGSMHWTLYFSLFLISWVPLTRSNGRVFNSNRLWQNSFHGSWTWLCKENDKFGIFNMTDLWPRVLVVWRSIGETNDWLNYLRCILHTKPVTDPPVTFRSHEHMVTHHNIIGVTLYANRTATSPSWMLFIITEQGNCVICATRCSHVSIRRYHA